MCRLFLILLLAIGLPAHAATFTVRSTADTDGGTCAANCTLRQALNAANQSADADLIHFAIPGEGPHRIAPISNLPAIVHPVTIDGYTQPGALPNTREDFSSNAVLQVHVDGAVTGGIGRGLAVCSGQVSVRGLAISRFAQRQIAIGIDSNGGNCAAGSGVLIRGNFIGLDPLGRAAATGISLSGVLVAVPGVAIGGAAAADRNVIAGHGAGIVGINAVSGLEIDGNLFGSDPSGGQARGVGAGVRFESGVENSALGEVRPNRFAFSSQSVQTTGAAGIRNRLARNVHDGEIDLGDDGVTPNDLNDADAGPNDLQNFPVLNQAIRGHRALTIAGTLDRPVGLSLRDYTISLYASSACAASGHGPGERLLDQRVVSLSNMNENFAYTVTGIDTPALGTAITAIATDEDGNSSEFSACRAVTENASALLVTNTNDSGAGSLRAAITAANANADGDIIAFSIPGAGPHAITVASNLPTLAQPVSMDGYTQPGAVANSDPRVSNASLRIHLIGGAALGGGGRGLSVCATEGLIAGLAVTGFRQHQVAIGMNADGGTCAAPTNFALQGNFIGLTPAGNEAPGPSGTNLNTLVLRAPGARVGGVAPAARNVIAGSGSAGNDVNLSVEDLRFDGNLVGSDPTGTSGRSLGTGLLFVLGSIGAVVGDQAANLIAFGRVGIATTLNGQAGNRWPNNSIFGHSGMGIDLRDDGVTANDPNDNDSGPNGLQNFPVLQFAQVAGNVLRVYGALDIGTSGAPGRYTIAVHESVTCDASGHGEGSVPIGSRDVSLHDPTPASGTFTESFALQFAANTAPGAIVTATATAPDGSTSEFSRCLVVVGPDQLLRDGFE